MESIMNGGESFSTDSTSKKSFLSHVFSGTEESKAEILNVVQYATMAVIPVVILNKLIQRFIPEVETDKSSLELLAEIFIQLIVMFCGIIVIHRIITYFPTYSGFKYENLTLTNVIIAFLIIVLSIQTKMGIKVNMLAEQVMELWNGSSTDKVEVKKNMRKREAMTGGQHASSQADYLDNSSMQTNLFPPAPTATMNKPSDSYNHMTPNQNMQAASNEYGTMGPQPANYMGSIFGSAF